MGIVSVFCAVLLLTNGVYLTARSKFFQFKNLKTVFKVTVGRLIKGRDTAGFKAMAIALGSTIGIGNIIGVASAILIGGHGAVFWMLVTGFAGMIIKYAEIHICVSDAKENGRKSGGPMYVIRARASGFLKYFSYVFAAVCILASFFAGNFIQSKSIYRFAEIGFDLGALPVTIFVIPLLLIILTGRDKQYQNFSAIFVPLMSVFYIGSALIIIFGNIKYVPQAVLSIFTSALGFRQVTGGFSGAMLSLCIRTGVMKGLFTHEAGMGSSPIAHSGAENADPFCQGCWGIVEVFIDTVVVCMVTAIAVLSSPVYLSGTITDPFELICGIFESTFGAFGLKTLSISACCFAFASIIGWSYYGIKSVEFFTDSSKIHKYYIVFFVLCVPLSTLVSDYFAWLLTDLFNSCMLIPNSVMLLSLGCEAVSPLSKIKTISAFKFNRKHKSLRGENFNDLSNVPEKMRS